MDFLAFFSFLAMFITYICIVLAFIGYTHSAISLTTNGLTLIGRKLKTLFDNKSYIAFYNIPYAKPPVKQLRFKPPEEYNTLLTDSIYNYSQQSWKTCANVNNEDCLYLSIFTPTIYNGTERYPVLVWANEYAHRHGPDFFIEENIIVVTVSYRYSIFGFLNTEDDFAEGNMGAKDILMALKWLRDNIILFNGDPNRITITGSGVASTSVASMLLSTTAEDLFTRAIVLDGSALSPADYRRQNYEVTKKLYCRLYGHFDTFNQTKLYNILNNTSSVELLAFRNLYDSTEVRDNQRLINSFTCSIEKWSERSFMNKSPLDMYDGKFVNNNVQVIFGYTTLPYLYKLRCISKNRKLLTYLNNNFQYLVPFEGKCDEYDSKRYRKIKREIMNFYFLNGTIGERSLRRYAKYLSDQLIYPLLRQAKLHHLTSRSEVYLYRFAFKGSLNIGWRSSIQNLEWPGATLGDETCYLFKCKSETGIYKSLNYNERHFIRKIVRLFGNFVKHGNPTPKGKDNILGSLQWKPLDRNDKLQAMNLVHQLRMIDVPEEKRKNFWDQLKKCFYDF